MSLLRLAGRGVGCAEDVVPDCRGDAERLGMDGGELEVSMMANVTRLQQREVQSR